MWYVRVSFIGLAVVSGVLVVIYVRIAMIPTTRIVGDLRGIGVSPASGVKVIVRLSQKAALYYGNVQVFDSQKEVFTDQNGLWSIDLVDTDFMEGDLFYYFWIAGREFRKFVPASSLDVNFNELEGYV